jgi:mannose-6-phosphate isomerase-like protein (cupin superfamily)
MGIRNVFLLKGEGVAIYDAKKVPIKARDSLLVPPRGTHLIRNTGTSLHADNYGSKYGSK